MGPLFTDIPGAGWHTRSGAHQKDSTDERNDCQQNPQPTVHGHSSLRRGNLPRLRDRGPMGRCTQNGL